MTRGNIYLVKKSGMSDPKRQRAFVVVSRRVLIDSKYATVVCAPESVSLLPTLFDHLYRLADVALI
jgi:mRNA-degrading endonuclease toxin of MazEF toxin-antitoxin module